MLNHEMDMIGTRLAFTACSIIRLDSEDGNFLMFRFSGDVGQTGQTGQTEQTAELVRLSKIVILWNCAVHPKLYQAPPEFMKGR